MRSIHVEPQARTQDFSWRGGYVWAVKLQTCRAVRGHAFPGEFLKFWITLDCISHVFMAAIET